MDDIVDRLRDHQNGGRRAECEEAANQIEALRDMFDSARLALDVIRNALGVPVEPHQSQLERMVEAAQAKRGAVPIDRNELQAAGAHPAPCARHCEATAFDIEVRNLRSQAKHSMLCAEAFKAEAGNLRRVLASLVDEIDSLIGESTGVYGLHQNGDPSPWHELLAGGRFQRLDLGEARAAVDRLAPASPAEILDDARRLIERAQHSGVVLTIETQPRQPLAMGNYDLVVETREARKGGAA